MAFFSYLLNSNKTQAKVYCLFGCGLYKTVCSGLSLVCSCVSAFNPTALRKAKIVCNFGLSECSRVKMYRYDFFLFFF